MDNMLKNKLLQKCFYKKNYLKFVHEPVSADKVATTLSELSPEDKKLRSTAISAIMEMDVQDVVKYLSYIKDGRI